MTSFQNLVAVLLVATSASGATRVDEFVDAALRNNVERQLSIEQVRRAEAEYRAAWTSLLPSLSATAAWTHNQYEAVATLPTAPGVDPLKLVIVPKDQLDGLVRVDLPLIDPARWMRTSANASARDAAISRERLSVDQIKRQVVTTYYSYAASLAVYSAATKSASVAETQRKLVEIRLAAGAATELETARAVAEVERTKQVVADASMFVEISRRTLRTLSGLQPDELVALPAVDASDEPDLRELELRAETSAVVESAKRDLELAEKMATASKLAIVPSIGAQFTERFTNATGFQGQSSLYNAGLNATWRLDVPTFQNMAVQNAVEGMAALGAERARLTARDQIFNDWQRFQAARAKIQAASALVAAAQRATQVARDRYAVGAATQLEVIQTERDVFQAEVGQIQAQTELATARAGLRISSGRSMVSQSAL